LASETHFSPAPEQISEYLYAEPTFSAKPRLFGMILAIFAYIYFIPYPRIAWYLKTLKPFYA
jgi:hypothetical protein